MLFRSYRDFSSANGKEAIAVLEHVLALDSEEAKARRLFAELLFRIGATRKARHLLEPMGTDDPEVDALLQQVSVTPSRGEDVDVLLKRVEQAKALPNSLPKVAPPSALEDGIGALREALAQLVEQRGVRKATYKIGRAHV